MAESFSFIKRLTDGSVYDDYSYHTVTVSCGLLLLIINSRSISWLDRARAMEGKAKEAFRKMRD